MAGNGKKYYIGRYIYLIRSKYNYYYYYTQFKFVDKIIFFIGN